MIVGDLTHEKRPAPRRLKRVSSMAVLLKLPSVATRKELE